MWGAKNFAPDAEQPKPRKKADRVWRNDGSGVFAGADEIVEICHTLTCVVPETRSARAVSLGDLDGDGDLDAFVGNYFALTSEQSRLWLNNGTGLFTDSGQGFGEQRAVALGDLDSDGDLDVFAGGPLGSGVALNQ